MAVAEPIGRQRRIRIINSHQHYGDDSQDTREIQYEDGEESDLLHNELTLARTGRRKLNNVKDTPKVVASKLHRSDLRHQINRGSTNPRTLEKTFYDDQRTIIQSVEEIEDERSLSPLSDKAELHINRTSPEYYKKMSGPLVITVHNDTSEEILMSSNGSNQDYTFRSLHSVGGERQEKLNNSGSSVSSADGSSTPFRDPSDRTERSPVLILRHIDNDQAKKRSEKEKRCKPKKEKRSKLRRDRKDAKADEKVKKRKSKRKSVSEDLKSVEVVDLTLTSGFDVKGGEKMSYPSGFSISHAKGKVDKDAILHQETPRKEESSFLLDRKPSLRLSDDVPDTGTGVDVLPDADVALSETVDAMHVEKTEVNQMTEIQVKERKSSGLMVGAKGSDVSLVVVKETGCKEGGAKVLKVGEDKSSKVVCEKKVSSAHSKQVEIFSKRHCNDIDTRGKGSIIKEESSDDFLRSEATKVAETKKEALNAGETRRVPLPGGKNISCSSPKDGDSRSSKKNATSEVSRTQTTEKKRHKDAGAVSSQEAVLKRKQGLSRGRETENAELKASVKKKNDGDNDTRKEKNDGVADLKKRTSAAHKEAPKTDSGKGRNKDEQANQLGARVKVSDPIPDPGSSKPINEDISKKKKGNNESSKSKAVRLNREVPSNKHPSKSSPATATEGKGDVCSGELSGISPPAIDGSSSETLSPSILIQASKIEIEALRMEIQSLNQEILSIGGDSATTALNPPKFVTDKPSAQQDSKKEACGKESAHKIVNTLRKHKDASSLPSNSAGKHDHAKSADLKTQSIVIPAGGLGLKGEDSVFAALSSSPGGKHDHAKNVDLKTQSIVIPAGGLGLKGQDLEFAALESGAKQGNIKRTERSEEVRSKASEEVICKQPNKNSKQLGKDLHALKKSTPLKSEAGSSHETNKMAQTDKVSVKSTVDAAKVATGGSKRERKESSSSSSERTKDSSSSSGSESEESSGSERSSSASSRSSRSSKSSDTSKSSKNSKSSSRSSKSSKSTQSSRGKKAKPSSRGQKRSLTRSSSSSRYSSSSDSSSSDSSSDWNKRKRRPPLSPAKEVLVNRKRSRSKSRSKSRSRSRSLSNHRSQKKSTRKESSTSLTVRGDRERAGKQSASKTEKDNRSRRSIGERERYLQRSRRRERGRSRSRSRSRSRDRLRKSSGRELKGGWRSPKGKFWGSLSRDTKSVRNRSPARSRYSEKWRNGEKREFFGESSSKRVRRDSGDHGYWERYQDRDKESHYIKNERGERRRQSTSHSGWKAPGVSVSKTKESPRSVHDGTGKKHDDVKDCVRKDNAASKSKFNVTSQRKTGPEKTVSSSQHSEYERTRDARQSSSSAHPNDQQGKEEVSQSVTNARAAKLVGAKSDHKEFPQAEAVDSHLGSELKKDGELFRKMELNSKNRKVDSIVDGQQTSVSKESKKGDHSREGKEITSESHNKGGVDLGGHRSATSRSRALHRKGDFAVSTKEAVTGVMTDTSGKPIRRSRSPLSWSDKDTVVSSRGEQSTRKRNSETVSLSSRRGESKGSVHDRLSPLHFTEPPCLSPTLDFAENRRVIPGEKEISVTVTTKEEMEKGGEEQPKSSLFRRVIRKSPGRKENSCGRDRSSPVERKGGGRRTVDRAEQEKDADVVGGTLKHEEDLLHLELKEESKLNARIKKIREQNALILRRQQEIQEDINRHGPVT